MVLYMEGNKKQVIDIQQLRGGESDVNLLDLLLSTFLIKHRSNVLALNV